MPGTLLGTPLYMAPEQMADSDVGPSADVFSLGSILFEILTLERARDPNALFAPVEARPSVRARRPRTSRRSSRRSACVRPRSIRAIDIRSPRALQEAIERYLEGDRELEQRRSAGVDAARRRPHATRSTRATQPNASYEQERGAAISELAARSRSIRPTARRSRCSAS